MLNIYKTNSASKVEKLDSIINDTWIELIRPTTDEIKLVSSNANVDEDLITKLLDDEELPRIEYGKEGILIVVDTPYLNSSKNSYNTYPLGVIIGKSHIITVSLKKSQILNDFKNNLVKEFYTQKKTRFVIQILLKVASNYQRVLRYIDSDISNKEKFLLKTTKNKELLELLNIEKTLVYFITSLKANDIVLEKLSKGNLIDVYAKDLELLEDAMIENKQAIEMANIYREILTSMTDTYATIISNNLNEVMKFLAGITIVFSIPTMIASFLGMNVNLGFISNFKHAFILIVFVSIIFSLLIAFILKKKDML